MTAEAIDEDFDGGWQGGHTAKDRVLLELHYSGTFLYDTGMNSRRRMTKAFTC